MCAPSLSGKLGTVYLHTLKIALFLITYQNLCLSLPRLEGEPGVFYHLPPVPKATALTYQHALLGLPVLKQHSILIPGLSSAKDIN